MSNSGGPRRRRLPGPASLRGLPPGLVIEILFGLQQRCAAERRTNHKLLRTICDDMRRQQVATIAEFTPGNVQRSIVASFLGHLRRASATAETEKDEDTWDLALFGHGGRMTFTAITQDWLRETAKRWVLEELPRRRGRRVGGTVQAYVNSVARLSESLRTRPDSGQAPAALGRADVENFLNRLAFQHSAGQISLRLRERICRDLRQVFEHIRALGLTRPGQAAAGLSDDFALLAGDVPHPPQPGEPSRDLPAEIIAQLCEHLDESWRRSAPGGCGPPSSCSSTPAAARRKSAPSGSTAWTGTVTGRRCWSMTTTRRPAWAGACRSARPPPS